MIYFHDIRNCFSWFGDSKETYLRFIEAYAKLLKMHCKRYEDEKRAKTEKYSLFKPAATRALRVSETVLEEEGVK
jgi:hypothetical protein